jgi:hypothetical protein
MNNSDYITAVNKFNAIKSFNMVLPKEDKYYEKLIPYIDEIYYFAQELEDLEEKRRNGIINLKRANKICLFVVHMNQVSNGVREYIDNQIV